MIGTRSTLNTSEPLFYVMFSNSTLFLNVDRFLILFLSCSRDIQYLFSCSWPLRIMKPHQFLSMRPYSLNSYVPLAFTALMAVFVPLSVLVGLG